MAERAELTIVDSDAAPGSLSMGSDAAKKRKYLAIQAFVVVGFFVLWQAATDLEWVDKFFISSPLDVGSKIVQWVADGSIWWHLSITTREALLGWVIGSVAGVLIGFVLGRSELVRVVFEPLLHLANTLPRIALAPLFIFWFGIGELSKVILVVTIVIFIMIFNTFAGVTTVNRDYVLTARLFGASELQLLRKVIFPWCVPWIFVGLRLGLAWSLSGAVVGEFIAARGGIGYLIFNSAANLDNTSVLAGCAVLLVVGIVFFVAISMIEKRLLKWRPTTD